MKIKKCPLCGGTPALDEDWGTYYIGCYTYDCSNPYSFLGTSKKIVTKAWNKKCKLLQKEREKKKR